MKHSHYGVVEIKNISSDLIDDLVSVAISDFHSSGVQNQEVNIDSFSGLDDIPTDILTMSGEFTQEQSDLVEKYFFSEVQEKACFYFEGTQEEINKNGGGFVTFLKTELELDSELIIRENEEWRDSYKKFFTHAVIDSSLVVLPDWNANNNDFSKYNKKLLLIPGMGFGTGGHETTRLCLQFLNKMTPTDLVLDLGCGSGILGNYCELFLSSHVDYVDVDQDALDNCRENRIVNGIDNVPNIYLRENFVVNKKYDVVLANILKPVLEAESENIINAVSENGQIIFSGLLTNQYEDLLGYYREKFQIEFKVDLLQEGEWVALRVYDIMGK